MENSEQTICVHCNKPESDLVAARECYTQRLRNNFKEQNISHAYLADLLDDFTQEQLVSMLNYFACHSIECSRASIKGFRKSHLNK